jgi:hypothetical protein
MTDEEYELKVKEELRDIPPEFHSAFRYMAYENGHAYGYEEVYGHLQDLVFHLAEPIQKYTERLKKSG